MPKDCLLRSQIFPNRFQAVVHSGKCRLPLGAKVAGQLHSDLSVMHQRVLKVNGSHPQEVHQPQWQTVIELV